jgi:hypothetical protein
VIVRINEVMFKKKIESVMSMLKLDSYELKYRNELECYDKVMELYPNYFTIWFILGLRYKQKAKEYFHGSKLSTNTCKDIK